MQEQPSDTPVHTKKHKKSGRFVRIASITLAGLLIFIAGVGVGSGRISFGTSSANKDLPTDLDYTSVEKLYDSLKANYDGDLEVEKLLDGMKAGLAEAAGDPYTVYLNAKDAKEFNDQLNGATFSGIGAELGKNSDGNLIVVAPIDGFPAAKAGLRPQDIIVSIDGESTTGMNIDEAVSKIRGPKDTQVKLRILRGQEDLDFTITRADIKVPSVKYQVLDGNIGYIQINRFGEDTSDLTAAAARDLKQKGVKGVILDLRGNPGGLLDASVDIASLWLPEGKVVVQQRRDKEVVDTAYANGNDLLRGVPTVILINEGSASASEIVAGALKDNKAAKLIGIKTYGKGSVQELERFSGGAELKVTVARWYTPNGQNIDKKGIAPDTEVKMTDEDYDTGRDPQKEAAIKELQ